ncbi:hypothetical protein LUZ60_004859 [Juncus effusus]|nr:hypothetical protein LUZ60_004859 [Juncus effusus]
MASEIEKEAKSKAKTVVKPTTPRKETESVRERRGRPPLTGPEEAAAESTVDYERCREERIRENKERLQKLMDLSCGVKTAFTDSNVNNPKRKAFLEGLGCKGVSKKVDLGVAVPTRRSSRLQNVAPVSYAELRTKKGDYKSNDVDLIEEGRREEIYTEEHEKLLGSCEMPWTLFVDGYGKDGKRIYDQVRGKTCHQCRQKTMGHRTSCYKCQLVQGQFCGDCLFMRYGENVLEVNKNPNWMCPPCRGICNCSLCRLKKGWNPTGALYKKIVSLGHKSVAHYLIQTHKASADTKEEVLSEMDGNTIGHTEAATPNPLKSESSGNGMNQEEERKRRRPVQRGNGEDSVGPVSSRLRNRQKA